MAKAKKYLQPEKHLLKQWPSILLILIFSWSLLNSAVAYFQNSCLFCDEVFLDESQMNDEYRSFFELMTSDNPEDIVFSARYLMGIEVNGEELNDILPLDRCFRVRLGRQAFRMGEHSAPIDLAMGASPKLREIWYDIDPTGAPSIPRTGINFTSYLTGECKVFWNSEYVQLKQSVIFYWQTVKGVDF